MRTATTLLLAIMCCAVSVAAQDKVAEGEYRLTQADSNYPQKHWVLNSRPTAGYSLRSEVQSPANGIRVLQLEDLDDQLVPTRISHELYLKESSAPKVVLNCSFARNSITCDGKSEKGMAPRSKPFPYNGPILFSVRDLIHFDFAWLMAGAINMAQLTSDKARLRTIHLTGGAALELTDDINMASLQTVMAPSQKLTVVRPESYTAWEFISNDDDDVETLTFLGTDKLELNGAIVPTRHYSLVSGDETADFWLAAPGILLKMRMGSDAEYVLSNYHQFRKLIPEIRTEDASLSEKN